MCTSPLITTVRNTKDRREQRTQVGTIVNGVFTYAKSYLLKQQIKDLKQEVKSSTADVVNKTSEFCPMRSLIPVRLRRFNILWRTCIWLLCSARWSGQTSCVHIADYWSNHRAALETVLKTFLSRTFLTIPFGVFLC